MCDLDKKLKQLVADACALPPRSPKRQRIIQELHYWVTTSKKLWKDSAPYYGDALQDMWVYCCEHLDDYDASIAGVITWMNSHLKRRLNNYRDRQTRNQRRHLSMIETSEGQRLDPVDALPARPDTRPLLEMMEQILEWVQTDSDGMLRATCFRKQAHINAQVLFFLRFPAKTPWQAISNQFDLNQAEAKDLPKFYNRRCLPLFRAFGLSQGYLDSH